MDLLAWAVGWLLGGLACGMILAIVWLNQKVRP